MAYGRLINPTNKCTAAHLAVSCPACGALKGSRCRGKTGVALTGSHQARGAKARLARPFNSPEQRSTR
jgi:hypothetical protein